MTPTSPAPSPRDGKVLEAANYDGQDEIDRHLEKKFLRKLDLRMSVMIVMYMMCSVDRGNVAAARLQGLEKDLGLKGAQYPTVLSIFLVGFVLMMVPSNMFLNYFERPSIYLPGCAIAWGSICIASGIAEASFIPGALLVLSTWYKQDELGLRGAILFCGVLLGTAFGTLMASGILEGMDGKLGQPAWKSESQVLGTRRRI
ncbi:hypothetical protein DXG01_004433 [Tephrocybe rancida]|nr:hypothetical protein DXG01_004433 [Tephrocybe rancida]